MELFFATTIVYLGTLQTQDGRSLKDRSPSSESTPLTHPSMAASVHAGNMNTQENLNDVVGIDQIR